MSPTLVSDATFRVLLTLACGGLAAYWVVHDVVFLARLRRAPRDASFGDQRFGYIMGIVIGIIGVVGAVKFNLR